MINLPVRTIRAMAVQAIQELEMDREFFREHMPNWSQTHEDHYAKEISNKRMLVRRYTPYVI